jgi:hypothetical protein
VPKAVFGLLGRIAEFCGRISPSYADTAQQIDELILPIEAKIEKGKKRRADANG